MALVCSLVPMPSILSNVKLGTPNIFGRGHGPLFENQPWQLFSDPRRTLPARFVQFGPGAFLGAPFVVGAVVACPSVWASAIL